MELESEICNFADDTTIYACDTSVDVVIIKLEGDLQRLMQWFAVYQTFKISNNIFGTQEQK